MATDTQLIRAEIAELTESINQDLARMDRKVRDACATQILRHGNIVERGWFARRNAIRSMCELAAEIQRMTERRDTLEDILRTINNGGK